VAKARKQVAASVCRYTDTHMHSQAVCGPARARAREEDAACEYTGTL